LNQRQKAKEAEWRISDFRIEYCHATIRFWKDELKLIDVKEYDPDCLSQLEKERRKKLVQDMFAELRKKSESEDFFCNAEEDVKNSLRVVEYCCPLF
jgi:hypothetical protein